jgi:hypothetical protein
MAVNRGIGSLAGADRAALELLSENNYRTAIGNALTGSTTPQNNQRISIPATPTVDSLQDLFSQSKGTYQQLLGDSEDQKKQTQAQMLFDIANTALAFSTAGSRPGMSPAERLAEAAVETKLFPTIGARAQAVQDKKQKLNLAALQSAETQRAAQAAAKSAFTQRLLEQATDVQSVPPGSSLFMGGKEIGRVPFSPQDRFVALSKDQVLVEPGVSGKLVAEGFRTPLVLGEGQKAVDPGTQEEIARGSQKLVTVNRGERVVRSDGTEIYVAPGDTTVLKEGDTLVNENNEIVARGAPKTVVVGEGQTALSVMVDESGINLVDQFSAGKTYVLSEGQKAINAAGETIGEQGKRLVLKAGDTVVDENNKIVAEIASEYTLGPNQTRLRGNTVIGTGVTPPVVLGEGTVVFDPTTQEIIGEGKGKTVNIPQGAVLYDKDTNVILYRNPPKPLPRKMMSIITTDQNGLETTQVVDINTERGQLALDRANELAKQNKARVRTVARDDVSEDNFFVPSLGRTVISYNQGRTYIDDDGTEKPTPPDRTKISSDKAYDIYKNERISAEAKKKLEAINNSDASRLSIATGELDQNGQPITRPVSEEEMATYKSATTQVLQGTGFWANLVAIGDNLIGGVGIAPETIRALTKPTQEARQFIQYVRIAGRSALSSSPRFAVADLQATEGLFMDERDFFKNPRTQVGKLVQLSEALRTEYIRLNTALADGQIQDSTLKSTYQMKISEIEKLQSIIGPIIRTRDARTNTAAKAVVDRINAAMGQ